MRNNNYADASKRTKSVTRMPGWILKIKGKFDSRKGKGVCDTYIFRLNKKLTVLESREAILAEKWLFESRRKAALVLTGFAEQKKISEKISDGLETGSVEDIRANRKNTEKRNFAKAGLKNSMENLTIINEQIISVNMILDERINKMRNKAEEKIHAYISGVRSGKLENYEHNAENRDDTAREIYKANHEDLDNRIRKVVAFKMDEGGNV